MAPENTLVAARKAHEVGADMWETDVAVTAADHLILMHDDAMMRTTDVADKFPERVPAPFSKLPIWTTSPRPFLNPSGGWLLAGVDQIRFAPNGD